MEDGPSHIERVFFEWPTVNFLLMIIDLGYVKMMTTFTYEKMRGDRG